MWTCGVRHNVNARHETAVIGASSPRVCFNYVGSIRQRGRCASMWTSGVRHNVNERHETAVIGASSPKVCFTTMKGTSDREGDVPVCGHLGCGTLSMSGMRRPSLEHRRPRYVSIM